MQTSSRHNLNIRRTVGTAGWHRRRVHMARGIMVLAVVVSLTAMLPSPSGAGQELGQFCWRLDPFVDTLRLAITLATGDAFIAELHVRWRAQAAAGAQAVGGAGPATYQLLGAGTLSDSLAQPGNLELGFEAVHNTTFFGGNLSCTFFAVMSPFTLNGSWSLQCPGPTPFTRTGTLAFLSPCPAQN
jgi:hypothetical protein